jgi:hypothetical protein
MTERGTFTCTGCGDRFQPHWREPSTGLCRDCAAEREGICFAGAHPHDGPCQGPREMAGDPCRYCGKPIPGDGLPCPDCTVSLESMTLADIKAVFAADEALAIGGLGKDGGQ